MGSLDIGQRVWPITHAHKTGSIEFYLRISPEISKGTKTLASVSQNCDQVREDGNAVFDIAAANHADVTGAGCGGDRGKRHGGDGDGGERLGRGNQQPVLMA